MLSELPLRLIHRRGPYGLSGVDNPCDLAEHQRAQQVRFHQRGFRVPQHLLQLELHLLNP
jgi:hypothetical protein